MGYQALYANTLGYENSALGANALFSNTTGHHNIAIGVTSLYNNIEASNNVAVGANALHSNTYAARNIAIGSSALSYQSYSNGTALFQTDNIAIGYEALFQNQPTSNVNGMENIAIGSRALYTNTTGTYNTSVGYESLYNNLTANRNVAIGVYALRTNSTGYDNTAIGTNALYSNTGYENTSTGLESLFQNAGGYRNTANGFQALYNIVNGNYNSGLGYLAGVGGGDLTNTTSLGANTFCTANNMVRVGDGAVTSIGGIVGWTTVSDARFKKDIQETVPGLAFITKLRPVTYHMDMNNRAVLMHIPDSTRNLESENVKSKMLQTGFIAQEVEAAANELGFDFSGVDKPKNENDFYGLRYAEFVVPLVKAVQEQQKIIEEQKLEITSLKNTTKEQQAKIDELEKLKAEIATMKLLLINIEARDKENAKK